MHADTDDGRNVTFPLWLSTAQHFSSPQHYSADRNLTGTALVTPTLTISAAFCPLDATQPREHRGGKASELPEHDNIFMGEALTTGTNSEARLPRHASHSSQRFLPAERTGPLNANEQITDS